METLWVYTIIISGNFINGQPGEPPEFVTGRVENKSALYFKTEEACNFARGMTMESLPRVLPQIGLNSGEATVEECKAVEMQVNRVEE